MLDPQDRKQIEKNIAVLDEIDKAVEGWTSKSQARQTGFSLYIKFTKNTDVMTSLKFSNLMDNSLPWALALARRLLGMDDQVRKLQSIVDDVAACYDGDFRDGKGAHVYFPAEVWQRVSEARTQS